MRKLVIAAVFVALMVAGSPVFAQKVPEDKQSEYYYVKVSVEKIYPYRAGYVVSYRKGLHSIGRVYLPLEWFTNAASKGEIINLPAGSAWPSLAVYYKNGEFSHVRLYVHRWRSHQTWGNIAQNIDIDDRFDNIETINISFK